MPVPSPSSSSPPPLRLLPATTRLAPRVAIGWHDVASAAGARALRPAVAGVPADATASIVWPGFREDPAPAAADGADEDEGTSGIVVSTVKAADGADISLLSLTAHLAPTRAHHLACALATLLEDHQVHDVLLLAALNVPTSNTLRDGAVYQVAMNGSVPLKDVQPLPPATPLADRFLASLLAFLGTTDARVRVLATPGKRTRRNGRVIPGVEDPDACIPVLVDAAERALGVKLSAKAAVAESVPPEEFQQDVGHGKGGHGRGAGRESGGDLLMYR